MSARHTLAVRNMQMWALALDTIAQLNRRGIPVIVLKSLPQVEDLYGDAAGRYSVDVDLVVPGDRVLEALDALQDLGWEMCGRHVFDLLAGMWGPDTAARSHPWNFVPPVHGSLIDLHSDGMDSGHRPTLDGAIWERAIPASSDGVEYLLLSPEDRLLFLCHHFLFESAVGGVPWHKLTDVELALRRGAELDWAYVDRRARQTGTTIALRLVCELVASRAAEAIRPLWREVPVASRRRYTLLSLLIRRGPDRFGRYTRSFLIAFSSDRPRMVLFQLGKIFLPSRLTVATHYLGAWPSWPRYLATLGMIYRRRVRRIVCLG